MGKCPLNAQFRMSPKVVDHPVPLRLLFYKFSMNLDILFYTHTVFCLLCSMEVGIVGC